MSVHEGTHDRGRVVVVGGGIGGLATALSVARAGRRVVVLERAPEYAEIGAGLQLAPNGLHALDHLGVLDDVLRASSPMDELRFVDGVRGRHVTSLDLTGDYQARFHTPYVVAHRAHLHQVLLDRCRQDPAVELRTGQDVVGYAQPATPGAEDRDRAAAVLAHGERVVGDVVVGADGLHSALRRQLVGDPVVVSGITVYRAVVPMERVPSRLRRDASVVWWCGPSRHLVHYPIAGGQLLNIAGSHHDGTTEAVAGVARSRDHVASVFAPLCQDVHDLIDLAEDWQAWTLVDREPTRTWVDGRVALLGDAAHPMLHYAAQGASQALEDAVWMGRALDGPGDLRRTTAVHAALASYARRRRERTASVQQVARASTALWHAAGRAARHRNRALRAMGQHALRDQVAWMHQERVSVDMTHEAVAA